MKTIIKYEAIDGKIFDSEKECIKYDKIAEKVNEYLKDYEDPDNFNIGIGYIQHPKHTKNKFVYELLKLANEWWPKEKFVGFSYVLGRYIDDSHMRCLNHLMHRYMCMDDKDREFEQPYYVLHPESVNKQLN